jgi:hypothetical protein
MSGLVDIVEIPPTVNAVGEYSIAALKSGHDRTPADTVEAVAAREGQASPAAAGFLLGGESASRGDYR